MNNIHSLLQSMHAINATNTANYQCLMHELRHIGDYKLSARDGDFCGWALCDGRSLSRAEYPVLFNIIGTKFGAIDGTTFKLPDYRGRVMGQPGQGAGLTERTMGAMVGTETHTLSTAETPSHTHTGTTLASGAHTHTVNDPGHTHNQVTTNDDFNNSGTNPPGFSQDSAGTMTWNNISTSTTGITVNSAGSHTHTFTTDPTGNGQPHNNMQPTLFGANVFIFTGVESPLACCDL